jgi:hypothetical protein
MKEPSLDILLEKIEGYLNEFIRQKIDEKYGKLEKILTDPAVEEIEVCAGDFGIDLESDVVGRELFFEFTLGEAYRKIERELFKEYPEHPETINWVLDVYKELSYLHSSFLDHLRDILKEHGFRKIRSSSDDCFIFRRKKKMLTR